MIGDLKGKVAIVTGGGQGIGEGIARCFARAGARVLIATRTAKNGQAVADSIVREGGTASLLQTDVGQHEQVKRAVAHAVSSYGRLDIVVHNAAVYPVLP
ncbi:MAG: SDR family NAD(P)-dependent oxidoreductase, partial [Sinobacteraceae bacterium]|nr:SDR family NAD(P)-dependent oxidoreductase [Nevskiaceae bacterium]